MRKYAVLFAFLGASASVIWSSRSLAAPKKGPAVGKAAPACGAKILPLVAGNVWTYNAVAAPTTLPEAMQRLAPTQPKVVVVTVTGIEKKGADTIVKMEEKHTFDMTKD